MNTPAPGIRRRVPPAPRGSLEHVRTVAELGRLAATLNQNGYAFVLDDRGPQLSAHIETGDRAPTVAVDIELLPIDTTGDTSLRLIAFDFRCAVAVIASERVDVTSTLAIISGHLPLGALWIDPNYRVHLSYTLAVDALGVIPDDVVVDVVHLLDRLFEHSRFYLQGALEGEVEGAELARLIATAEAV